MLRAALAEGSDSRCCDSGSIAISLCLYSEAVGNRNRPQQLAEGVAQSAEQRLRGKAEVVARGLAVAAFAFGRLLHHDPRSDVEVCC